MEEKGGFVWLFYGSNTLPADVRPPIPYVPELGELPTPMPANNAAQLRAACLCHGAAGPFQLVPVSPPYPRADDPEWQPVYEEIEFDCNHFGVFENAIDMAHIHYLHSDSFGNQVCWLMGRARCQGLRLAGGGGGRGGRARRRALQWTGLRG